MVNKQLQRVSAKPVAAVANEEIIKQFPVTSMSAKTVLILKQPKTESSIRKIYLPRTVAEMLKQRKKFIDSCKEFLGDDNHDYGLVVCYENGTPMKGEAITKSFKKKIKRNNLKPVVFHSLRHSSTTYKLKISGGDIKAVQGDTGHAQASMITERYAHILDDDRRINAERFEEMFYQDKENSFLSQDTEQLLKIAKKLQESPELLALLNKFTE